MWELVTRLMWLPFDIMQRISQRFLQLGRSIYGSLIAPATKPAIKPPPPPTAPASISEPFPVVVLSGKNISSSPSSASSIIPCCVTIDMESVSAATTETKTSTDPSTTTTSSNDQSSTYSASAASTSIVDQQHSPSFLILAAAASSAELNPERDLESQLTSSATTNTELSSPSEGLCDVSGNVAAIVPEEQTFVSAEPELPTSKLVAVTVDEPEKPAQVAMVVNIETRAVDDDEEDDRGERSSNPITVDTPPPVRSRPDKRFREREQRRPMSKQIVIGSSSSDAAINTEVNDSQSSSGAKKPKSSEEREQPSTSSTPCEAQGSTITNNKDISRSSSPVKKNKKRRSKKNKKGLQDQKESKEGEGDKMGVERTPPPNFFIAIQIANKEIVSNVAQLQKSLTERDLSQSWHGLSSTEIFKDAMVPVAKLHFTLHVMHLKGEDDLLKAQSALTECCSEVHQEFVENPMDLTIEGLGHFRNNVIFAQIKERSHIDRLTKLSEIFRKRFKELNIPVDPRPFNPHMTIAKISRSNKLYKKKIRAFPSEMWSGCEQTSFGKQRVTGLQLLQMAGEDKATGYYQCFGQHYFEDPLLITKTEWQNQCKDDQDKDKDKNSD